MLGTATVAFFAAWGGKKEEVPPAIATFGFSDDAVSLLTTLVASLFALHVVSLFIVPTMHTDVAKSPQLAAHFVVTLVSFVAFAYTGTSLWLNGSDVPTDTCFADHISGYCAGAERITLMMMAFQMYEVGLALLVPKLRGPSGDMLIHHLATLSLATIGGGYQYLHFYAPFFFGLTEISSVPLAVMDMFKFYPALKASFPATNEHTRSLFAAIFIVMRLVYWPYVCSEFWMDSIAELSATHTKQPTWVVMTFLVANIILSGLQFFWVSLIFKGIAKKLMGETSDVKGE